MDHNQDEPTQFASSPCMLHELDPGIGGQPVDLTVEMRAWRKRERERLIGERLGLDGSNREAMDKTIAARLEELLGHVDGRVVSAYWPFRNEPDLKPFLKRLASKGATPALPVVVAKHEPLVFRAWLSGDMLARGVWNIPYPAEGAEVIPDIVIAPVVGFDRRCFRLGYGGGFFDRTLAGLPQMPLRIGVGYDLQFLPAFQTHRHDIAMEMVVTPGAVHDRAE